MTDPTSISNNNVGEAEFLGFAGTPVVPPPPWAYDPLADELDDERQTMLEYARRDHYQQVGLDHATAVVDRLIAQRRGIETEEIDLDMAVAQFDLTDSVEQDDYADGLCRGLAWEADALESAVEWLDRGIGNVNYSSAGDFFARIAGLPGPEFLRLFREVPGAADGNAAGVAELFRRAGGLSQQDVRTLVDQVDKLTRELSAQVRRPLPNRLKAADRQHQLRTDAVGLAVTIDQLSVLRALPSLAGDHPGNAVAQREQLAAQIAAVYAAERQLLYHLPADRAAIVRELLPGIADQTPRTTSAETEPAPAELTDLRAAVDTLITALSDGSGEDFSQLAVEIAAQYRQDPTLTWQLPSTQAGLVRHLFAVFEDTAFRLPPAEADPKRRAPSSTSHQATAQSATATPPGTAGGRHAGAIPPAGTARGR